MVVEEFIFVFLCGCVKLSLSETFGGREFEAIIVPESEIQRVKLVKLRMDLVCLANVTP